MNRYAREARGPYSLIPHAHLTLDPVPGRSRLDAPGPGGGSRVKWA